MIDMTYISLDYIIAAKAEPISVIWHDYLKNAQFSVFLMDSTPIHVTRKFARHYRKDCESETHVNLDFRMPSMISEMAVVLVNI